MNATLTRIAAHSPQGLFFLLFPAEAAHVARQIEQVDGLEELTLISSDSLLLAAPEATGVYLTGPELGYANNINQATAKSGDELIAAYKERYGEGPTSMPTWPTLTTPPPCSCMRSSKWRWPPAGDFTLTGPGCGRR